MIFLEINHFIRNSYRGNGKANVDKVGSTSGKLKDANMQNFLKKHTKEIVRIQAAFRGYQARKYISLLKSKNVGSSKYFTYEESKETISSKKGFDPNQRRERRPAYTFNSKAVYTGEWKGGFRDGYGEQQWPDGARYEGEWRENRAHGKGQFVHVDGDVYDGQWANDKANGLGVYMHVNGAKYEGMWRDDLQHGKGVETWTDGSKYEGEYAFGRKHGVG